jgi:hypothetical protein
MLIADDDQLHEDRCLLGFPHPSGDNGQRAVHFRRNEEMLRSEVARWAGEFL